MVKKAFPSGIIMQVVGHFLIAVATIFGSAKSRASDLTCQDIFRTKKLFSSLSPLEQIAELRENAIYSGHDFLAKYGANRTLDASQLTLDNYKLELIETGRIANLGVYRILGEGLILKVHRIGTGLWGFAAKTSFARRLLGNYLGSLFKNVVEVVEFGTLTTQDGTEQYYTIMKEAFPSQNKTTLKNVVNNNKDALDLFDLASKHNPLLAKQIASSFVAILKLGILTRDPDIMISEKGEIMWLDTDFWKIESSLQAAEYGLVTYQLYSYLNVGSQKVSSEFKKELLLALDHLPNLHPEIKTSIRFNLNLSVGLFF